MTFVRKKSCENVLDGQSAKVFAPKKHILTVEPPLMDPARSRQPLFSGQAACYEFNYLH